MRRLHSLILCGALLLSAVSPEEQRVLRRLSCYHLVGDHERALDLAKRAMQQHSESGEFYAAYVESLARKGDDREAVRAYHHYLNHFPEVPRPDLAELVAWCVIEQGSRSSLFLTQLAGMLAGVVTQEVQAVSLVGAALRSSDSALRTLAAELAAYMGDASLMQQLLVLLREERLPEVRAAAAKSLGRLQVEEARPLLESAIAGGSTPLEERLAAIEAVVAMTDSIKEEELRLLASSPRAGLRQLACQLIAELDLREMGYDYLIDLLKDTRSDVRIQALNTLGLLRIEGVEGYVRPLMADPVPGVSITACWLMTLLSPEEGMSGLCRWVEGEALQWQRIASGAVAATGRYGAALGERLMRHHPDPYVRATVSLGLLGQRLCVEEASEELFNLFNKEKGLWMWDRETNPLFGALAPSRERFKPTIPNYPELVSQTTRLEIVGALASAGHPEADGVLRDLLRTRGWNFTGMAAASLLGEGDELAVDLVRGLLDDEDPKVRVQAALALALWGRDPSAVAVLEAAYPEADRETKITILEGIGRVGAPESQPFLVRHMADHFSTLRVFSASALIQSMRQSGGSGLDSAKDESKRGDSEDE